MLPSEPEVPAKHLQVCPKHLPTTPRRMSMHHFCVRSTHGRRRAGVIVQSPFGRNKT